MSTVSLLTLSKSWLIVLLKFPHKGSELEVVDTSNCRIYLDLFFPAHNFSFLPFSAVTSPQDVSLCTDMPSIF